MNTHILWIYHTHRSIRNRNQRPIDAVLSLSIYVIYGYSVADELVDYFVLTIPTTFLYLVSKVSRIKLLSKIMAKKKSKSGENFKASRTYEHTTLLKFSLKMLSNCKRIIKKKVQCLRNSL